MFDEIPTNLPTGSKPPATSDTGPAPVALPEGSATASMSTAPATDMFAETEKASPAIPALEALPFVEEGAPKGKKVLVIVLVVLAVLLVAGFASAIVFGLFKGATPAETTSLPPPISDVSEPQLPVNEVVPSDAIPAAPTETTTTPPAIAEEPIIVDSDGDGLTDEEEARFGTSIRKPDTDNDGLFDKEEVQIYKTNPLKADSDGDGYLDGSEVSGGYNPNGPGKLMQVPKP